MSGVFFFLLHLINKKFAKNETVSDKMNNMIPNAFFLIQAICHFVGDLAKRCRKKIKQKRNIGGEGLLIPIQ